MVLRWHISIDMTTSIVTDTVRDILQKERIANGAILHSDQDSQYLTKRITT